MKHSQYRIVARRTVYNSPGCDERLLLEMLTNKRRIANGGSGTVGKVAGTGRRYFTKPLAAARSSRQVKIVPKSRQRRGSSFRGRTTAGSPRNTASRSCIPARRHSPSKSRGADRLRIHICRERGGAGTSQNQTACAPTTG